MTEATDLASWFSDDELEPCPNCGVKKLIPGDHKGLRVCLNCGPVGTGGSDDTGQPERHTEPSVTAHRRESEPDKA